MAPRVLIGDYAPTRLAIRMALGEDITVCAEAEHSDAVIRAARREQPDLCLIGGHLAGDGFAAVRGICRAAPNTAVVVLSERLDPDDLLDCARAGAVGYASAASNAESLLRIVRAVIAGEAVVPRSMVLELMIELRGLGNGAGLTEREAQVLGMLRRGHSTAAIAERLEIVPVTVRRHISQVVEKLGVEDRSALFGTGNYSGVGGSGQALIQRR